MKHSVGEFLDEDAYLNARATGVDSSQTMVRRPEYRAQLRYARVDQLWQKIFARLVVVRRRNVVVANVHRPLNERNVSETVTRRGYEIAGDEMLRGKAYRKYAKKRMSAVRFLKPHVPYLQFKHASLKAKRKMCHQDFQLENTSSYFYKLLVQHFGDDFDDLERKRPGVIYLGSPGRQGVALLIEDKSTGMQYVFKVAHSVGDAGFGSALLTRGQMRRNRRSFGQLSQNGGALGMISQAKFQMMSAMHNCTVPVYACGVTGGDTALPVSFLVMPPLKMLAHEYAKEKLRVYSPDLVRSHIAAKYFNLMLKMDTLVGINHNDANPRNIMMDEEDDMVLIDFDRASLISHKDLQKYGRYINCDLGIYMALGAIARFRSTRALDFFALRRAGEQLFNKDVNEQDDDIAKLNTDRTPAKVPLLPYNAVAGDYAAMLPESMRRSVFGNVDEKYTHLRF